MTQTNETEITIGDNVAFEVGEPIVIETAERGYRHGAMIVDVVEAGIFVKVLQHPAFGKTAHELIDLDAGYFFCPPNGKKVEVEQISHVHVEDDEIYDIGTRKAHGEEDTCPRCGFGMLKWDDDRLQCGRYLRSVGNVVDKGNGSV